MAATTGGAIKAFIESLGLGLAVYRDEAPQNQALPYVVVTDGIAMVPDSLEDGAIATAAETVQIDLNQQWRDPNDNRVTESSLLLRQLLRALQGSRLMQSGTGVPLTNVYALIVRNAIRIPELENNLVRHAITAEVFQAV